MTPDDFEQRLTILHQQLTDLQDLCRTLSRRVRFLEEPPAKYMSISASEVWSGGANGLGGYHEKAFIERTEPPQDQLSPPKTHQPTRLPSKCLRNTLFAIHSSCNAGMPHAGMRLAAVPNPRLQVSRPRLRYTFCRCRAKQNSGAARNIKKLDKPERPWYTEIRQRLTTEDAPCEAMKAICKRLWDCYVCDVCGYKTRRTGAWRAMSECVPLCYEIGGIETAQCWLQCA